MSNNKANQTVIAVSTRKLKIQTMNLPLANTIFSASLVDGLTPFFGKLVIELTTDNVPSTGKAIRKMYLSAIAKKETFKVFNGANEAENLYFTPETNLLYRTLHDIDHANNYASGNGTTSKASELYLNCLMAKRAYTYAIETGYTMAQSVMTFLAVYHDTVGQVYYYFENNDFCENQKALTTQLLNECEGMKYLNNGSVTSAKQYVIGLMNTCKVSTVGL